MKVSKKGSVFVEASIVFPIIILAAALIIGYSQKCFEAVKIQADEHNNARNDFIENGVINMGECDFARRIDLLTEAEQ